MCWSLYLRTFCKLLVVCLRSVTIMLMTKITLDRWMLGRFHNKLGVIVSQENKWTNMCQCTTSRTKTPYFSVITKLYRDENAQNFWLHSVIFFTSMKFSFHTAFQSLLLQIIRIWELFFRSVESYYICKHLCPQRKTALPLNRN